MWNAPPGSLSEGSLFMDKRTGEFWFVVGSQTLYGPQVLETVERRAREMPDPALAPGVQGRGKERPGDHRRDPGGEL